MKTKEKILEYYRNGSRFFRNVDFNVNESFTYSDFRDTIFENCFFGIDFSYSIFNNTLFIDCNLKATSFTNCTFINTYISNCSVEGANFLNCKFSNLIFENNTMFGIDVDLNQDTFKIEQKADPFL